MISSIKKAVMYGGGNIGRGFIAQLFYMSGYETVFIDVNDALVNELNSRREYPVFVTNGNEYERFDVKNVRAVNGRNAEVAAEEIASADLMATAVGVNVLKYIAPVISAGVKLRAARSAPPLNIIICENLIDADIYLRSLVLAELDEAQSAYCAKNVGFVEASIGRMVPATPDAIKEKEPLAVCVEPYCMLPVDKRAIVGDTPKLTNLMPSEPFELYIRRKLYMHNMSHAVTAYIGAIYKYTYIWEAAGDFGIRFVALGALTEAANALAKEYRIDNYPLMEFSFDLLSRFDNRLLGDTIARVGRDTLRKLSPDDRICGLIRLCLKNGIYPSYVMIGLAAGLRFTGDGDESSRELYEFTKRNGVRAALEKYCGITDAAICERTEKLYNMLGKSSLLELINLP